MAACARLSTDRPLYPGDSYAARTGRQRPQGRRRTPRAVRRRRTLMVLFVLVLIAAAFLFPGVVHTERQLEPIPTHTYVVDTGDTLWSIAAEYAEGRDIRKVIYEIKYINGLRTSMIYPGQELRIPLAGRNRVAGR